MKISLHIVYYGTTVDGVAENVSSDTCMLSSVRS